MDSNDTRWLVRGRRLACRRGFALVVILAMLGLVLSLLLLLGMRVREEVALSQLALAREQARANARLGLSEALAVLREHGAHDSVVTARAQMLGEAGSDGEGGGEGGGGTAPRYRPGATLWTGLWQVRRSGGGGVRVDPAPLWLVSGKAQPHEPIADERRVTLVSARTAAGGGGSATAASASSASPSAASAAVSSAASSVPSASAAAQWPAVEVPLVPLGDRGGYAWWVGDEGVKINIASPYADVRAAQRWLLESRGAADVERLARQLPQPSLQTLLPVKATAARPGAAGAAVGGSAADAVDEALRARLLDVNEIALLAQQRPAAAGVPAGSLFHELTVHSMGVLASPLVGLRRDYSLDPASFALGGDFSAYADYRQAMETPRHAKAASGKDKYVPGQDDLRRRYRMRAAAPAASGELATALAPVLTDCYLLFNVHRAHKEDIDTLRVTDRANLPGASEIVIHAGAMVELWNPYTSALVPQDLLLEIEGLPQTVRMHASGGRTYTVPLRTRLSNGPSGSSSWWIELPFDGREVGGATPTWFPGRVYNWVGPNNYSLDPGAEYKGKRTGNFFNRNLNAAIWAQPTGVQYVAAAGSSDSQQASPTFTLSVPQDTVLTIRLRLKPASLGSWRDSGNVLAEFRNVRFDRIATTAQSHSANSRRYQFGYRVRLEDPGLAVAAGSTQEAWRRTALLRRADPRDPVQASVGEAPAGSSYHLPYGKDPLAHVQSSGVAGKGFFGVSDERELWNRSMGNSGLLQLEDAPLFELPRQNIVTLADLRHAHVVGERAYAIGNRWGGALNRVFDHGFFSGLHSGGDNPDIANGQALPNARLVATEGTVTADLFAAPQQASQRLLLHGAFNVNNLSPSAWRAVLSGLYAEDFSYIHTSSRDGSFDIGKPTRTEQLGVAMARYAHSAAETFDVGSYRDSDFYRSPGPDHHNPAVEPPTQYFRRGIKGVSEAQLDLLAKYLVRRIAQRAQAGLPPFGSLEEFLSGVRLGAFAHPYETGAYMSVLEAAVLDTMADTSLPAARRFNRDEDGKVIWWDAPAFVNGGDIWALFAHYAAVRSDTFRIRALGRSDNGGATAWCEAIVQRLPAAESPGAGGENTNTANADEPQARRFEVLSFRWLGEDEI